MAEAVQVEGLGELLRAFGRVDAGVRKELTGTLRGIARGVAAAAKAIAEFNGLRDTGTLISKITISVGGGAAYVRATAKRWPGGFPYPAVYEYGKGGQRAFLAPALRLEEPNVLRGVEGMLDALLARNF